MRNLYCFFSIRRPDPADSTTLVLRWDDIIKDIAGKWAFRNYTSSITTLVIEVELMFKIASSNPAIFTAIPATISTLVLSNSHLLSEASAEHSDVLTQFPETITTFRFVMMGNRLISPSFFKALGSRISTLDLTSEDLGCFPEYDSSQLSNWLHNIPQDVNAVNLSFMRVNNLQQVFNALPRGLRTIDLAASMVGHSHMDIRIALYELPQDLTILNLLGNDLSSECFVVLPRNITTLDLSHNKLGRKSLTELVECFGALPRNITTLNLSNNELGRKSLTELVECFKALPRNITTLNLSENHFFDRYSEQIEILEHLSDVFSALPTGVSALDLSANYLGSLESNNFDFYMKRTQKSTVAFINTVVVDGITLFLLLLFFAIIMFAAYIIVHINILLPFIISIIILSLAAVFFGFFLKPLREYLLIMMTNVTQSNIFSNTFRHVFTELWWITSKHVALKNPSWSLFSGLPSSVTTLKLGRDDLMKDGVVNKQLLDALPQNITTLHLSRAEFSNNMGDVEIDLFNALPSSITTLKLARADLFKENGVINIDLFHALPLSVTRLIVDEQAYDLGDCLLSFLVPELMDILIKNDQEILQRIVAMEYEPIKPIGGMDEILLEKCITFFENHPSSKGFLVCALLMEGLIENHDEHQPHADASAAYQAYHEARALRADHFYSNAAKDDALKSVIDLFKAHLCQRFKDSNVANILNQGNLKLSLFESRVNFRDANIDLGSRPK